jgi:hypothetical protein
MVVKVTADIGIAAPAARVAAVPVQHLGSGVGVCFCGGSTCGRQQLCGFLLIRLASAEG